MRKYILIAAGVYFCFLSNAHVTCADEQADLPVASAPAPAIAPVDNSQKDEVFRLNEQEMEDVLAIGESGLKGVKVGHRTQEQKQHVDSTEKAYQEAISLYRQKRSSLAREALSNVADSMADYKLTNKVLRTIDDQNVQKLKLEEYRVKEIKAVPIVTSLSDKATKLYEQSMDLGDDEEIVVLRKKLARSVDALNALKMEKEKKAQRAAAELRAQENLDTIAQKADNYDRQVAKLIKAGDYAAAKAKFNEFQSTMAYDLRNVKESVPALGRSASERSNGNGAFDEGKYKRLEENFFQQGIDLYRTRNYEAARIIFSELAYQGNPRAQAYLKKTERLIEEERSKEHGH